MLFKPDDVRLLSFFNYNLNINCDNPLALSAESNYVLVMNYDSTDTLIMILDILSPSINLRHYYGT